MIIKRQRINDEDGLARCIAYLLRQKKGIDGERLACPLWLEGNRPAEPYGARDAAGNSTG